MKLVRVVIFASEKDVDEEFGTLEVGLAYFQILERRSMLNRFTPLFLALKHFLQIF